MTTIYFAGGEDSEHFSIGGGFADTNGARFRNAYARCALSVNNGNGNQTWWQNFTNYVGTPSSFWFSCRLYTNGGISTSYPPIQFVDAAGLKRLQVVGLSSTVIGVQKINSAGTLTTLANTLTAWIFAPTITPDKIDINWVNAVSGSIDIYYNGVHVYNFSGDTTTETTTIAAHRLQGVGSNVGAWSEIIVSDSDTRNFSLQTLAPVANGNTHNFDTGSPAAANVNEITLNDTTLDGSTTAAQIDEYTIPAIAAGTWSIIAVGVSARMLKGTSGPTKMDLVLRSGTTDYFSADQVLTTTFADYQNWWLTDPNTSAAWVAYPVNIGLKSVA